MPTYPDLQNILYYVGKTFAVEWYYDAKGRMPGLEYYRELEAIDQERLDYMVKHLADSPIGTQLPKTLYRIEDKANKIYAFKPRAERFFHFTAAGRKIIITNAYRKHSQQMTKEDLETLSAAIACRNDYFRRVAEGTYYENQD